MNDIVEPKTAELNRVFAAAISRDDQWRQLNAYARAWADAKTGAGGAEDLRGQCRKLLGMISRIEHCFAYPGTRLLETLRGALEGDDASGFARLVQKVSGALQSGDFQRDERAWDTGGDGDGRVLDRLPPDLEAGAQGKPYFEVLIVTPTDPAGWNRADEEVRRMQRPEQLRHLVHQARRAADEAERRGVVHERLQLRAADPAARALP